MIKNTCLNEKIQKLRDQCNAKIERERQREKLLHEAKVSKLSRFLIRRRKIVKLYLAGEADGVVEAVNSCLCQQYTKEDFDRSIEVNYELYKLFGLFFSLFFSYLLSFLCTKGRKWAARRRCGGCALRLLVCFQDS